MKLSGKWRMVVLVCSWVFAAGAATIFPFAAEAAEPITTGEQAAGAKPAEVLESVPAAASAQVKKAGTILFVPLDDRPVCRNYSVDTVRAAGWDVEVPPDELLAGAAHNGDPDKVYAWLTAKAPEAVAIVASTDSLIYGGLVPSRTHHFTEAQLEKRVERLLNLKKTTRVQNIYTFTTIMRSPRASSAPVEPAYYAQWGPKIFRLGQLEDRAELGLLKAKEKKELTALKQAIPAEIQADMFGRRALNLKVTKKLLNGVAQGDFDYLVIGRDDSSTYSQAHLEARKINHLVQQLPKEKIRFFAGADEIGLLMMTRAVNNLRQVTPLVYTFYAAGKGGEAIPSYEDDRLDHSVKQHIFAAGAYPVPTPKRADTWLGVFLRHDGVNLEANSPQNDGRITAQETDFVQQVKNLIQQDKPVIVADVAFGNGASKALVQELFKQKAAWQLAAYGGWNTAGNAMGFALGQGLLAPALSQADRQDFLTIRYLEDWGYQAQVRQQVYQDLIWANDYPGSQMPPAIKAKAEAAITADLQKVAAPLLGTAVSRYRFTLPWNRMFEVYVSRK
jgi:hypothetical protein